MLDSCHQTDRSTLGDNRIQAAAQQEERAIELCHEGRYMEALEAIHSALEILWKVTEGRAEASIAGLLMRAGNLYLICGQPSEAERTFRFCREIWLRERALARGGKPLLPDAEFVDHIADCGIYIGAALLGQGQYEAAETELSNALSFLEGENYASADSANQIVLAQIYIAFAKQKGADFAGARRVADKALQALRSADRGPDSTVLLALIQFAVLLHNQREYQLEVELLSEALKQAGRIYPPHEYPNGHPYVVNCLQQLGLAWTVLGNFEMAEFCLTCALQIHSQLATSEHDNTAADLHNKLGVLAGAQGNYEAACQCYARSVEIREHLFQERPHTDLLESQQNLAVTLLMLGRYAEAARQLDPLLGKWAEVFPQVDLHAGQIGFARCLIIRSMAAAGEQDGQAARDFAIKALRLAQRHVEHFAAQASEAETLNCMAETAMYRHWYLQVMADADATPDYELLWDTKAHLFRVLTIRQKILSQADASEPHMRERAEEWLRIRSQLADPELPGDRLVELTRRKEALERTLAAVSPGLETARQSLAQLRERMPSNAALIDYYAYNHFVRHEQRISPKYGAFIVHVDGVHWVELGDAAPVNEAIDAWIAQIRANHREEAAPQLYERLWKPLIPYLPPVDEPSIYLSPDGELARLPWSALPDESGAIHLDRYRTALVPSGPFLAARLSSSRRFHDRPSTGAFLLVADVAYSEVPDPVEPLERGNLPVPSPRRPLAELRGTAMEADLVKEHVPALFDKSNLIELRREKASVSRVVSALPRAQIAHIASHGQFSGADASGQDERWGNDQSALALNGVRLGPLSRNPLTQVAIALAGVNLPAEEAGMSRLSGEMLAGLHLPLMRLCVLPDCHSSRGEHVSGEGAYGLPRAFHQAAADDVLSALWHVSDEVAPAMMHLFYERLARGLSPIDALRETQREVRRAPEILRTMLKQREGEAGPDCALRSTGDFEAGGLTEKTTLQNEPILPTRDWAVFVLSGLGE